MVAATVVACARSEPGPVPDSPNHSSSATMPPKLISDAGDNVVIRPLIYCAEDDLVAFSDERKFPILPCDLCGSQENMQRKAMTRLLADMDDRFPGTRQNMLAALGNVRPSHLFDKGLWKRLGLEVAVETESPGAFSADAGEMIPASRLLRGSA